MSVMFTPVLVVAALAAAARCSVIDLSSYAVEEFRSELENYDALFVKVSGRTLRSCAMLTTDFQYYAPYCGHCKSMAKDFVTVAKNLEQKEMPVQLAQVDCTSGSGTKICKRFNVKGYPTLQLFKMGKPDKIYEGVRCIEV